MSCRCYRCDLGQELVEVPTIKCFESDSEVGIAKYTSSAQDAKSDPNVTECLNGPTSDYHACGCHPQVLLHQILLLSAQSRVLMLTKSFADVANIGVGIWS